MSGERIRFPFSKQEFSKVYLLWRGQEQVSSAHNLGNAHQCIVHYYGKLVCPGAVLAADDVVSAVLGKVERVGAIVPVGEGNGAVGDDEAGGGGSNGER